MASFLAIFLALLLAFCGAAWVQMRRRSLHTWLGSFLAQEARRIASPRRRGPIHVLLCIADHFEPALGNAGVEAVEEWATRYPALFGEVRDSDGRPPRHTFFYPVDEYNEQHVEAIADLCAQGFGELEIHLHHDDDTAANLEQTLLHWTGIFARRHSALGRWPDGRIAYGFVHGNWALNNSRPDGRWCGVNDEVSVLVRTGCYADFTLPSAPSPTQTRTINSIYYATSCPHTCKSHDRGTPVGTGAAPADSLMLIQGPLSLYRGGLLPRIENACIQDSQPPTMERLDRWIRAGVGVVGRPDWVFIKLHTHGAKPDNRRVLLGETMLRFHQDLAARAASDPNFHFHYVTAREMYNLAKAAEAGWELPVRDALDFAILPPGPDNTPDYVPDPAKCASLLPAVRR